MTQRFTNSATTTLVGLPTDATTALVVLSAGNFPVLGAGEFFYLTLFKGAVGAEVDVEIVKVTETSGTTFTVVRAQEGTTAIDYSALGGTVNAALRWTAAGAMGMVQKEDNLADLPSAATARTNLGLGSMATQNAGAVAITGGTIAGVTLESIDSSTTIKDDGDATRQMRFELGGIASGQLRTMTVPDANGTLALTSDVTAAQTAAATNAIAMALALG